MAKRIKISYLDTRMTILARTIANDTTGQAVETFTAGETFYCQLQYAAGYETTQAKQPVAVAPISALCRFRTDIDASDRLQGPDGTIYTITEVADLNMYENEINRRTWMRLGLVKKDTVQ